MGELSKSELIKHYYSSELLFLPSQGENFGYAIAEALSFSLPVLISDKTFFSKFDSLVHAISLNDFDAYVNKLIYFASLEKNSYNSMTDTNYLNYSKLFSNSSYIDSYKKLLN